MGLRKLVEMPATEAPLTEERPTRPPSQPGMRAAVKQAREIVAANLPAVVQKIADDAVDGNVVQIKLFLEIGGVLKGGLAAPEKVKREKSLEEIINEELARDRALGLCD